MDTISLSLAVFEIFDFKKSKVWPRPLTPRGHLGSKNSILFGSPYMTSYLTSMDTISLSLTVFEIFVFKKFRAWPWPLTPKGHLGSKLFIPFESPYMTSYLTSMDTVSLSLTVFEIFDFKNFRVWPWPLTLKVIWGRKILYRSKAHIWLTIWLLWTPSLYLLPLSRYSTSKNLGFRPWPLTFKSHLGSKKFIPFESPYMTSYLTSMDTISLSLTVFEIFDFKKIRVWQWPLTPKGYLGSKNLIPFESPYMTSYLTSMGTISLSLTVFEIFDFKNFRVRPWPLTPKDHLGSKIFYTVRKPIYDFLFDFYGHHLSISYRYRDIRLQKI